MLLAVEPTQIQEGSAGSSVDLKDFMFLIEVVAHKFRKKHSFERIHDSEVYSVAAIELVKAAATYNPKINTDFSRFAYKAMQNGVIEYLRYCSRKKRAAAHVFMSSKEWSDIKEKEKESQRQINSSQILSDVLKDCPDDTDQDKSDKKILIEVYIKGKKVQSIADEYGISRVTVYNRINRIIKKIRDRHSIFLDLYGSS